MKMFVTFLFVIATLMGYSDADLMLTDSRETHFIEDLTSCGDQWMSQLPDSVISKNRLVIARLNNQIPSNLEFLPLLEPYLSYLTSFYMEDQEDMFLQIFSYYCNKDHGVSSFISCMKKQPYMRSIQMSSPELGDVTSQLYDRYCDSSGKIHDSVIMSLLKGSNTKAVQRLAKEFIRSTTTGDEKICSDVIDSYTQTVFKHFTGKQSMRQMMNSLRSGVEAYAKCIMVTFSKGYHAKQLREHMDMVLLQMFGSNTAVISRTELNDKRQMVAMIGYNNILSKEGALRICPGAGTRSLIANKNVAVTGTIMYEHKNGALLPYLAAVHVKVTLYKSGRWDPLGQVTYSSGLRGRLNDVITTFWWDDVMRGRVSDFDHGVSIQSYGTVREIIDNNSGTHIAITRSGNMLSMIIRMSVDLIHQSRGFLVDDCQGSGHSAEYRVLRTNSECRKSCSTARTHNLNSICRRNCQLSDNRKQISDMYRDLEQMIVIAESKDDFFETPFQAFTTTTLAPIQLDSFLVQIPKERADDGEVLYSDEAIRPVTDAVAATLSHKVTTSTRTTRPLKVVKSKRLKGIEAILPVSPRNSANSYVYINNNLLTLLCLTFVISS